MWFGIGKLWLEKKKDQNINVPNNYAHTVRCGRFTKSVRDRKIESKLRVLIQIWFKHPHIYIVKIIYNIRMFAGPGHACWGSGR